MSTTCLASAVGFTWLKNESESAVDQKEVLSTTTTALSALEDLPDTDELILCVKRGIVEWHFGNLVKSEQLFHEALKLIETRFLAQEFTDMQQHQARAYVLNQMANLSLSCGYWPKAEKLFLECMRESLASGESQNSEAFVEMSLKLANLFARQGRHEEAQLGFKWCAETQLSTLEAYLKDNKSRAPADITSASEVNSRALLGMVESSWGSYLLWHSQPSAALPHLKRALAEADAIYSEAHPNRLSMRCDVALALAQAGGVAEAVLELQEVLRLAERSEAVATDDGEKFASDKRQRLESLIAVQRVNLGRLLLQKGDMREAQHECTLGQRRSAAIVAELLSSKSKDDGQQQSQNSARRREWQQILDEANLCMRLVGRASRDSES